ncbi:MAG: 50S ribosomal protein L25/general stress protein Ctc [Gammaproteobacteria bacterium]|nr:50S ribosomal protein L25/general stress protein Ctc [Gammaproteobacteria bacterium]NNJ85263.1 50S ribosomal protein L25/general stress protein Ctc [Gammaproteobacteria bacterium]
MKEFEINANIRNETGSRASRRMRRGNNVPAVLYGAKKDPVSLFVDANELKKKLDNESFGFSILSLNVEDKKEPAILKAVQRHPVSSRIVHLDFQRISEASQIQLRIPLHFINEEASPAKQMGLGINRLITEVEISCLPRDLPEAIIVDMSNMAPGQNLHLSELILPEGAVLTALSHGTDQAVATVFTPREMSGTEETGVVEETGEEGTEDS